MRFKISIIRYFSLIQLLKLVLWCKLELTRQHIIHQIVKVVTLQETLSLVAGVHGGPAQLVIFLLPLHEGPDRTTHHWDRIKGGEDQHATNLIYVHTRTEELAWEGACACMEE